MPNKIIPMSDEQANALAGANLPNQSKFIRDAIREKLATMGITFPDDNREWGEYPRPKRHDQIVLLPEISEWDEWDDIEQYADKNWVVLRVTRDGAVALPIGGAHREFTIPLRYIAIVTK